MEMDSGRGCDWGVWLEWVEDSEFKWLRRDRDGDGRATLWVWVTKGWFENWLSFELLRWNADVCVAVFGWLIWIVWMKGWTRISSHFVDCRSGKKESGGAFVIDWVDLADWDLLQIWAWMRYGWFATCFDVHFERYGGNDHYFEFPRFWLDFHHFRCMLSIFPCSHNDNTLSNAAEWDLRWMEGGVVGCVWHKESHVPLGDQLK